VKRELWFTEPRRVELRASPHVASLGEGQVRARALASGLSQGTELLLFKGEGPTPFDPSLDAPGASTYPRRYGYAWVGEVTESVTPALAVGARVFGLLAHGDEHVVAASLLRMLPPNVPPTRAVLAANLETAINVVWDAGVGLGDQVVVLGGGIVGLLSGWLSTRSGARVSLLEPSERRRAAALALGFDAVFDRGVIPPAAADIVLEASGDPANLDHAIALARDEATIVVASFYGRRVAPLSLGHEFHRRRLTLRASQVSRIPPARSVGWSFERRFALVTELLQNPILDALLDEPVRFEDAPSAYARLLNAPGEALQTVFAYAP
jgi:D-arabinose 1-dehydrogenase-like Zn-dependent alcohol dehydrogenase